jgi:hypothetical protein
MIWRCLAVACVWLVAVPAAAALELLPWQGRLPGDALAAGTAADGSTLGVCVVNGWGGSHPGILGADGVCSVAWGGQEHRVESDFLVLVDDGAAGWEAVGDEGPPAGAFPAGGDDSGPIFVCRVSAWGGVYPGKLTDEGWCYVPADGSEHVFTDDYEVLVD